MAFCDFGRVPSGGAILLLVMGLAPGCRCSEPVPEETLPISPTEPRELGEPEKAEFDREHLGERVREPTGSEILERALREPGRAGAATFEARRGAIVARAKNEPAFFIRTPRDEEANDEIAYYRWRIRSSGVPWKALTELLPYFGHFPDKGRQTLLREGYLYAEDPNLAFSVVSLVGAHHLFDSERIWVHRGERVMHARRKGHRYVYDDGPYSGQPVRLLHLDRIGGGKSPETPPLHRDFRALRYRLGFDRARVRHITETRLIADLRYGESLWIPTILQSAGARLDLVHEVVPAEIQARFESERASSRYRIRGVQALRNAMLEQVAEKLPFDEPRTEVAQEDGKLRRSWEFVYGRGRSSYEIRGDRYPVFDAHGRPLVPQVCVDFVLDTFERAGGTWWRPKGESPGRSKGALDFEEYMPRLELRRAERFLEFASGRPEWFDVLEVPGAERVEMGHKARFFDYLVGQAEHYAAGDVVFIRGKTPWDDREEHTHSFFIYETDPITAVPIAVAGNAHTPEIWSWETEARRTPLRTVRYRVRPTLALLQLILGGDASFAPEPPPLVPGGG